MVTTLLQTKLYIPPIRPKLVSRPRLIERLNTSLPGQDSRFTRKLTLISAPAGFGKTTLISEWISRRGEVTAPLHVAWLSLDESDSDPVQFLTYLAGALQTINAAIGQSVKDLVQSPQLAPAAPTPSDQAGWVRALTTALINDVTAADIPLMLVLDDYHLISSAPVHQVMRFLLEHQPSSMHVVISTREDPSLPLARLRARGQMTEIREHDLRFTAEEAAAFLNRTMGLRLSPETVAALETRTEGWIAGLQLAALALQETVSRQERKDADAFVAAFTGSDRHVTDYMVEEVLHRQPEEIQRFLLHTAILDRLSAPLCDALISDISPSSSSQAVLEHLDAANLFVIPLDNKREWYRYHQLFADLLRYQLQREHPEQLANLHRHASRWYEQAGVPDEAFHHALAIPDSTLAAHVAEQYGIYMCGSGRVVTYLGWIQQIPDDVIYARPYLCAACGWAYALTRQVESAERYVRAGEAALASFENLYTAPDGRSVTHEEVHGHLVGILAYAAQTRGDRAGVIACSQQALAQLPADAFAVRSAVALNLGFSHLECGETDAAQVALVEAFETAQRSGENAYVASSALFLQGQILVSQGKLREARKLYQQIVELGTVGNSHIPTVGMGHRGLGLVHYERYELVSAAHHFDQALTFSKQVGNHEFIVNTYLSVARLALVTGDLAQVEECLDQADKLVQAHQLTRYHLPSTMIMGELCLAQGDADTAAQYAETYGLQIAELRAEDIATGIWGGWLPQVLLLPRILLARHKSDEALELLDRLAPRAEAHRYGSILIEARVLQALAWHRKKNDDRALEYLEHALTLAAPEEFARPFVVAGEPMDNLLRQSAARGVEPEYAGKLLALFGASEERPLFAQPLAHPVSEPLSEREIEVLRLIAAGLSNQDIAQTLFIAVSTVKSHVKHVYGKLGVQRRTEAIVRARELGLL